MRDGGRGEGGHMRDGGRGKGTHEGWGRGKGDT